MRNPSDATSGSSKAVSGQLIQVRRRERQAVHTFPASALKGAKT
jgi:hypothetical protein